MFDWIYDQSPAAVGLAFCIVFVVATWLAIFAFRRFFHTWFHRDRRTNDMVGFALSSYAVFYALLLGLIAVAVYQNFTVVDDAVTKEASSLAAVYHDLRGYPEPMRDILQGDVREYIRNELERSWPEQQRGYVSGEGAHRLAQFVDDMLSFQPAGRSEEIVQAEAFRQLNDYIDFRSTRVANVAMAIPAVLWSVVIIGAVIFIVLLAMLDMEIHVHLILATALSLFLGLLIFLIAEMDHPFQGRVSIGPEALAEVYDTLIKPDAAVNRSMSELISLAGKLGSPRVEGTAVVAGRRVPRLHFGAYEAGKSFDLVDRVARQTGGGASLFVKSGDDYVRISTNIRRPDGSRALGTVLDPHGPAIQRIRQGQPFYGAATILGVPYITGYEPIKDAANNVIGIYGICRAQGARRAGSTC